MIFAVCLCLSESKLNQNYTRDEGGVPGEVDTLFTVFQITKTNCVAVTFLE